MMPVVAGAQHTKQLMFFYTVLLVAVTLSLSFLGMLGNLYTLCALVMGGAFLYHVYRVMGDASDKWPRKTFLFSILYLFVLFSGMIADSFVTHLMH